MGRIVVPLAALVVAAGAATFVLVNRAVLDAPLIDTRPSVDTKAAAPAVSKPAPEARDQRADALATAKQQANNLAAVLPPSHTEPDIGSGEPAFDIVRIEPTGEAVVAGRAAPGATVELLRNGEPIDRAVADQDGQFAMVPPSLPPGTYDLTLRATQADGKKLISKQSVAVALGPSKDQPMVAMMAPDKPTVVLSQPSVAATAGKVIVEAVDVEPDGKLHVSGRGRPGAAVRLYLNDSFIASVTAGADGHLAVTINKGVTPGSYRIRLDEVEANTGIVQSRAEVPLNVPEPTATASVSAPAKTTPAEPASTTAAQPQPATAAAATTTPPEESTPSAVVVSKVATITVSRGDSLWRISRRELGVGTRYAVLYKANRGQIRNPNLIYPGQVFVLPSNEAPR